MTEKSFWRYLNGLLRQGRAEMGELLINGDASISAKEAIIMILAHHPSRFALNVLRKYNKSPDEGLEFFAEMALDEFRWWNE